MARGNEIIVSANPRGVFMEGVINAALKPGTIVQIDVSEGMGTDARLDWEAFSAGADGNQRLIAVLLPDVNQGKIATDAYASGDRCFLYVPCAGEELNCLMADVTGTADDHVFGELMIVDSGTGKLIATTGSPESEPFMLLEDVTDPTADQLVHVMYSGY